MNATYDPLTLVYHELRAPLGLMVTAAQSAAEDCDDVSIRSRCEMIVRTAERMLRTAQEVFDLNRAAESGSAEVYLPALIANQVVGDLRGLGVDVSLSVEREVGSARTSGVPATFEALLNALISNARDHAAPGTHVTIVLGRDGQQLCATVTNFRSASDTHVGIGAGKYIEEGLARQLGGSLEMHPDADRYVACFRMPVAFF